MAYTLPSKTTVEFVYERVYWSSYKELDFNYVSDIPTILKPSFDGSIAKNWKDTNTFRLGVTQVVENYTLMAGVVYDQSPVPEETVSYELPDSDSVAVSLGMRYQLSPSIDLGLSGLYSMRESRQVNNDEINGKFSNSNVLMISAGLGYKF